MKLKKCIIYTVSAEKVVVISLMEGDNKDALPKKATHFGQLQVFKKKGWDRVISSFG